MIDPNARARLDALLSGGGRRILGIAGLPGAGKSTLTAALLAALGHVAVGVPMDGFHLANAELHRLGRADRKGAPDTFDVAGYIALLRRLRSPVPGETIYAPAFHREIEEPIAGEIAVRADTRLVITEGNYLLMDDDGWRDARTCLDEVWFVEVDDTRRRAQLLERHVRFGRDRQAALDWIEHTDEPNARRIAATAHRADFHVRLHPDMAS
ncbi:Phosphoribulokinase / Uridine kinase family protein [Luteibacter sp. UNCMF331Sha3.1]|uniref:nucleoside/nucleotide kinase family protein n=1 Tax=Luteibacter sp. UNCMF331Sha3.1 TaxID=1502760 RepID=UPI0008C018AF|nr:nucleoside/nucleotide kinase family protein [Luteibacter sp. UNCMF331Sha3.1]SEN47887.1 Phosphoribulokinase / Uridine kinase family protein [Luteibacter sp. UNCMF331Sha3.1]